MALRGGKLEKIIILALLTCLPIFFMPEMAWLALQQQEGDVLLEQGKQDYIEGRFEDAVEKLNLALKLLTDRDKLIDAYLHLGFCHFALGERDKAKQDLAELLRINPAQRLDPLYYPPDFVNLLEEVKKGILAQLKVETDPPIAQVFLDEELVGVTPLELTEVAAGEHKLRVVKQGYKTSEERLSLNVGEEKTVYITLEKEEKKPAVAVTPPEKKPEVKKKSNTLMWILIGGAAAVAVLILAGRGGGGEKGGGGPSTGSIHVTSTPTGAKVFLDGRDTGQKTTTTLTNVSVGSHELKLVLGGYKIWTRTVHVAQGLTTQQNASLEKKNLTVRIKVTFKQANMRAHWKIRVDGKVNLDDWIVAQSRGGTNKQYKEVTRQFAVPKKIGTFTIELEGLDYQRYYNESSWISSTKFEISIAAPESDKNLVKIDPDDFYLNVAPWRSTDPDWPQKRTKKVTLSPDSAARVQYQEPSLPKELEKKLIP